MPILQNLADSIYKKSTPAEQGGPVKRYRSLANQRSSYAPNQNALNRSQRANAARLQAAADALRQQGEEERARRAYQGGLASRLGGLFTGNGRGLFASDQGSELISPFGATGSQAFGSAGAFQNAPGTKLAAAAGGLAKRLYDENVRYSVGVPGGLARSREGGAPALTGEQRQAILGAQQNTPSLGDILSNGPGGIELGGGDGGGDGGGITPPTTEQVNQLNEMNKQPDLGKINPNDPNNPDNQMLRALKEWYRQQRIADWAQSKVSDYYEPPADSGPSFFDYGGGWGYGGGGGGYQDNQDFWLNLARWDVLR